MNKPFNLEAALAGAKVVTRDGRPVKIAGYNPEGTTYGCIVGWVPGGAVGSWSNNGVYHPLTPENENDLFMAPVERKEWIVHCYRDIEKKDAYIAGPFKNVSEAELLAQSRRPGLATIHEITIIE